MLTQLTHVSLNQKNAHTRIHTHTYTYIYAHASHYITLHYIKLRYLTLQSRTVYYTYLCFYLAIFTDMHTHIYIEYIYIDRYMYTNTYVYIILYIKCTCIQYNTDMCPEWTA